MRFRFEPRHEKPGFGINENKDADQLRGNSEADQRLCFRYTDSLPTTSLIRDFKPLAIFFGCTALFVSDLIGKPEDRFSHNKAQLISYMYSRCNPRINVNNADSVLIE